MKKLLFFSILCFLFSCGPSKAELEKKQREQMAEGNQHQTYEFYDSARYSPVVTARKIIIDSCEWFVFEGQDNDNVIHNPHCTKGAEQNTSYYDTNR